jgi:hypothetical protein
MSMIVRWLAARSSRGLFGLALAWFVVWTAIIYLVLDTVVAGEHQAGLADIAGPLMTAFGALFAFLTAFVITIEWNQHREVEHTIGLEADACVRMAWASEAPGTDGEVVRGDLTAYLRSVVGDEWPTLPEGSEGCESTHATMRALQRRVRTIAADPAVPPSVTGDLIKAADHMAITRADRLNAAGHDLPTPLFLLAFLSGVMLTLNSVALSLHLERGYAIVIGGLVILIAMDLALLVALSTPFTGGLQVHSRPLARVLADLEADGYGPRRDAP